METGFEPSIIEMRGQFADHQTEPTAAQFSNLSVCLFVRTDGSSDEERPSPNPLLQILLQAKVQKIEQRK